MWDSIGSSLGASVFSEIRTKPSAQGRGATTSVSLSALHLDPVLALYLWPNRMFPTMFANVSLTRQTISLAETHFSNMWCCNTEGQKWFSRAVVAAVPCCVCSVQLSATWSWEVWGQLPLHPPTWGLRTQASEEGVRLGLRWRKDQHEQRATSVIIWFISRILAPQVLLINK